MAFGRGSIGEVVYTGDDEAAPEIRKLLADVTENEDDFVHWEKLVTTVESLEGGLTRNSSPSAIELVRNVYDRFLSKFPLFFGYWKKYAELEFAIGGTEAAEMVYERGVASISNSVDLWAAYCTFKVETCHDNDVIRELYERGAQFVGLDFMSHPFWDKYIEFEERIEGQDNIFKILGRVIRIPMYHCSRYFERFRPFITSHPIGELVEPDILERFRVEVASESQGQPRSDLEVERMVRARIDNHYLETFKHTHGEMNRRWTYEQEIKRPYFHVTELDDAQLANWRKYLDFEEAEGGYTRTAFLYERCLVACALYDEFWLRYARWMYAQPGKQEEVRFIYMRASCTFVPISTPEVRLHWARFEEKANRIDVAIAIHEGILFTLPGHLETILSWGNLERRHSGVEAALRLYEDQISSKEVTNQVGGALVAEQARLLWRIQDSPDKARQLYQNKFQWYPDVKAFWFNYLQFEMDQPSIKETDAQAHARIKRVHELIRVKTNLSPEDSKELSHHYMSYLLECGGKDAAVEYMDLDKEINGYVSSAPNSVPLPLPPPPPARDTARDTLTTQSTRTTSMSFEQTIPIISERYT